MIAADVKPAALSPSAGNAQFVCTTCKSRKKGCDKKLPSCSYCTSHSLICHYGAAPSTEKNFNPAADAAHPLRDVAAVARPWSGDVQNMSPSIKATLLLVDSFLGAMPAQPLDFKEAAQPMSVDAVLYLQVCRIIAAYGKYIDDISVSYFQGVHRWLPVISRRRFHDHLMSLRGSPSADFSVLLLAMCLVTNHPSTKSSDSNSDQDTLYLATKMLFAHTQGFIATSMNLIQAGLLIATYEYTQGLADAAYVSIGTCARMAHAFSLPNGMLRRSGHVERPYGGQESTLEQHNLLWGIVLCDRFVASESTDARRPFAIDFPSSDFELPLELDTPKTGGHLSTLEAFRQSNDVPKCAIVCSFGRESQAAFLYESVRRAVLIPDSAEKRTALSRLDGELQEFLHEIMTVSASTWGLYCGSITFTIGALFVLHEHILKQGKIYSEFAVLGPNSHAALKAASRMVIEVARSFNQNSSSISIETLPPRCSHLVSAGLYLLESSSNAVMEDIEQLRTMLRFLSRRWNVADKQLSLLDLQIRGSAQSRLDHR